MKRLAPLLCLLGCAGMGTVPPADPVTTQASPEQISRGRYLTRHVTGCIGCHSPRRWDVYSAPARRGAEGAGGENIAALVGLGGFVPASNITPAAIGHWSNGEVARAITSGVGRDGNRLVPFMPYRAYSYLTASDVGAIVAYLRTLEPITHDVPRRKLNPILRLFTWSQPRSSRSGNVEGTDSVSRGRYLARIAGCHGCHTSTRFGSPRRRFELAGGVRFRMPEGFGTVVSTNITPDRSSGIGNIGREEFIGRFKSFAHDPEAFAGATGRTNTVMPWIEYAGMTTEDLGAIYDYLRTVPAVTNRVVTYP